MTERFQVNERVYKMLTVAAEPYYVVGIKPRRFNRDLYLVSKAPREAYIEIVSADRLVKAPILERRKTAKTNAAASTPAFHWVDRP